MPSQRDRATNTRRTAAAPRGLPLSDGVNDAEPDFNRFPALNAVEKSSGANRALTPGCASWPLQRKATRRLALLERFDPADPAVPRDLGDGRIGLVMDIHRQELPKPDHKTARVEPGSTQPSCCRSRLCLF